MAERTNVGNVRWREHQGIDVAKKAGKYIRAVSRAPRRLNPRWDAQVIPVAVRRLVIGAEGAQEKESIRAFPWSPIPDPQSLFPIPNP